MFTNKKNKKRKTFRKHGFNGEKFEELKQKKRAETKFSIIRKTPVKQQVHETSISKSSWKTVIFKLNKT